VKVYFACSIRGGGDTSNYLTILNAIKSSSVEVLSEVFVHDAINLGGSPLPAKQIYNRDISMIEKCDAVIAEVSNPSLGVGYELAYAENRHKPILCLFDARSDRKLSAMITGNDYFIVKKYSTDLEIAEYIEEFVTN